MRIKKDRLYLALVPQQDWHTGEWFNMTTVVYGRSIGTRVARHNVIGQWDKTNREGSIWALEDGHILSHMKVCLGSDLEREMKDIPQARLLSAKAYPNRQLARL